MRLQHSPFGLFFGAAVLASALPVSPRDAEIAGAEALTLDYNVEEPLPLKGTPQNTPVHKVEFQSEHG